MNGKWIRIFAFIVILGCFFVSGISVGVITQSVQTIRENWAGIEEYTRSADFLLDTADTKTDSVERDSLFAPFWQSWELLHAYYVDQPVDDTALMEGAIRGMLEVLGDPHTRYADPASYKEEVESAAGEYQGIGAYVDLTGEYVRFSSVIPGSPAEEAGIQPDDLVIALNGEDMTGQDPNEVLLKIRGPEGTSVTLTIRRGEAEPFDMTVTRRRIETASVEGKMLEGKIAYVSMSQFGDKTTQELRDALDAVMDENPKGLILDLRGNGGGYLTTAIETASEFLPLNTLVLLEKEGNGKVTEYYTERGGGRATKVPMVVLIDGNSASASEIVTGALRCHERATVIGTTSYGKGSVQVQTGLENGGALSVTIARWYTPDDVLVHGVGITPDITVEFDREAYQNGVDNQLEAAVSFLNGTWTEEVPAAEEKPEENSAENGELF